VGLVGLVAVETVDQIPVLEVRYYNLCWGRMPGATFVPEAFAVPNLLVVAVLAESDSLVAVVVVDCYTMTTAVGLEGRLGKMGVVAANHKDSKATVSQGESFVL
jgi:hypothetical protein